jgi:hypothetical protein
MKKSCIKYDNVGRAATVCTATKRLWPIPDCNGLWPGNIAMDSSSPELVHTRLHFFPRQPFIIHLSIPKIFNFRQIGCYSEASDE